MCVKVVVEYPVDFSEVFIRLKEVKLLFSLTIMITMTM